MSALRGAIVGHALALLVAATAHAAQPPTATGTTTTTTTTRVAPARFGPFDAGTPRAVTRQGDKGRARRPHPVVGAVDQIPGAGAPPPPLRRDPYLPEDDGAGAHRVNVVGGGLSSNPLYLASLFYSNFLTRTDGPRCQHLPTCSRFANQAVARYGVLGIPMGLDRLIQPSSSSSLRLLPEVDWNGTTRFFDPLDNYEFWRSERFTGFPPPTPEEPLLLPPNAPSTSTASSTASSTATSTSSAASVASAPSLPGTP